MMVDPMSPVFRALSDPSRRLLLDRLFERDGQTLGELCLHLPEMTRFGVMRHLDVLEAAGLVTTRRDGREKRHHLNPVPIRLMHDRWISKYAEPLVGAMAALKASLEEAPMIAPEHVYELYIRTTADRLWQAITDPEFTRRYWYGALSVSEWRVGSRWESRSSTGEVYLEGEIVEIDPPRRLIHTFHVVHESAAAEDPPSTVEWEITPMGDACRLRVMHSGQGDATRRYTSGGWETILSGLKTLLETGEPLHIGGAE